VRASFRLLVADPHASGFVLPAMAAIDTATTSRLDADLSRRHRALEVG